MIRTLVLGIHTLGLVLALWLILLIDPEGLESAAICGAAGAVWLYTAYRIIAGKDARARKVEDFLNRRRT